MKVVYALGSTNPAKINAVKAVVSRDITVFGMKVDSTVSEQPFSDEETMKGAIARAKGCLLDETVTIGFGLEGGVMEMNDHLMLCNWGALVDRQGETIVASGAKIMLPYELASLIREGQELGVVIDEFASETDVRKKGGTIGILTNDRLTRSTMFEHIVQMLIGQYEFRKRNKKRNRQ